MLYIDAVLCLDTLELVLYLLSELQTGRDNHLASSQACFTSCVLLSQLCSLLAPGKSPK